MKNIIRFSAGVNLTSLGKPEQSWQELASFMEQSSASRSDVTLFPRFALGSPSYGSLWNNGSLQSQMKQGLAFLTQQSAQKEGLFFVGLVWDSLGQPCSALAVLHKGERIALLPLEEETRLQPALSPLFSPADSVFQVGNARLQVCTQPLHQLVESAHKARANQCDLLLVPLYEPMVAGKEREICQICETLSRSLQMGIVVVNGGNGDTSSPALYQSFFAFYENGTLLSKRTSLQDSLFHTVDFDLDKIRSQRKPYGTQLPTTPLYGISTKVKLDFLQKVSQNPFLPDSSWEREEYLTELFSYQVVSLARRMENTGIYNLVLGVSGGIDSTAALLVAVATCDFLGLPHSNVYGITLPGMGTSDRTYYNALSLVEQLEITQQDINIQDSVLQHFQDIGHSGQPDTTYENAQARERTQILLDIANMVGGLVVGTGDLSEEALGFCTFGGDHLSSYNVNVCLTKTMLRAMLEMLAGRKEFSHVESILLDILSTPVSPELLPLSEEGEIQQKTEEILGPYPLHEFFLYYFVHYQMAPSKIYEYACLAFSPLLEPSIIWSKLALFLKKFCANQFKRSCSPDAARITPVNLLPTTYQIPSDLNPALLLQDLETIKP